MVDRIHTQKLRSKVLQRSHTGSISTQVNGKNKKENIPPQGGKKGTRTMLIIAYENRNQ